MRLVRIALIATVIAAIAAPVFAQGTPTTNAPKTDISDAPSVKNAPLPTDFTLGDKKAKVTIIEYASLSCPHCAHFHATNYPVLKKDYIDTGKVKYILRQFPLNAPALKGAMLVDCMGEKRGADAYYTFTKVLFDAQNRWAFDANFLTSLKTFAAVGGVSEDEFTTCTSDEAREKKLLQGKQIANQELGVPHTPYFIINGKAFDKPFDQGALTGHLNKLLGEDKPAAEKK